MCQLVLPPELYALVQHAAGSEDSGSFMHDALVKHIFRTTGLTPELVVYLRKQLSLAKTAEYLDCHVSTIKRLQKQYDDGVRTVHTPCPVTLLHDDHMIPEYIRD